MFQNMPTSSQLIRLSNRYSVTVAGQVVVHQAPPTAKGHYFVMLEDEAGMMNIIIRPDVVTHSIKLPQWQGYGVNDWNLIIVEGIVQRKGGIVNVLATKILPLA